MSWVTDLSHFIDETGNLPIGLPTPARRLAAQLTAIVAAATAGGANEQATRRIKCRRRPGRQACSGVIEGASSAGQSPCGADVSRAGLRYCRGRGVGAPQPPILTRQPSVPL